MPVVLHKLMYGSAMITVIDLVFPRCRRLISIDRSDEIMLAYSIARVISKELFEYWLYALAMIGGMFREAFEMSCRIAASASARFTR